MVVEKLTMSPSVFSFVTTIILGPLAALVGGILVAWSTRDVGVGLIAGIAGLAAGIVVSYLFTGLWMARWPTEYDPVDNETWERAQARDRDWDSRSHSPIEGGFWTVFFWALFFGGTFTVLVATLLLGWLLGG